MFCALQIVLLIKSQRTVVWHVDDIKSSHVNPEVNRNFSICFYETYGEDWIGKLKSTKGKNINIWERH